MPGLLVYLLVNLFNVGIGSHQFCLISLFLLAWPYMKEMYWMQISSPVLMGRCAHRLTVRLEAFRLREIR
jgi:hypothetical protein